jgi:hypothetical protein
MNGLGPPEPDQDPKRACESLVGLLPTFHNIILPVHAVIGKMSFLPIRDWGKAWADKRDEFTSHTYTSPAASFQPLFKACSNLQKAILEACEGLNLDAAIIGWPTMANEQPTGFNEIRRIHEWLVVHDVIDEPVEVEVTTGKSLGAIFSCPCCLIGSFLQSQALILIYGTMRRERKSK